MSLPHTPADPQKKSPCDAGAAFRREVRGVTRRRTQVPEAGVALGETDDADIISANRLVISIVYDGINRKSHSMSNARNRTLLIDASDRRLLAWLTTQPPRQKAGRAHGSAR